MASLGAENPREFQQVIKKWYPLMCAAFDYYTCLGKGDMFSISLNEWGVFLLNCEIPEEDSITCKLSNFDTIFIATNFEDEKKSLLSKNNIDDALMRFEFLEALTRAAKLKYIDTGACLSLSEAFISLMEQLERSLPPEAKVSCIVHPRLPTPFLKTDRNRFRMEILYTQEMNGFFSEKRRLFQSIFHFYKGRSK